MKKLLFLILALGAICEAQQPGVSTNGSIGASGSSCPTAGACVNLTLPKNTAAVAIVASGTFSATLQFEESSDGGTSIVSLPCSPQPSGANVTSATAAGTWICPTSGMTNVQVRASSYSSGTPIVTINSTSATPGNANQSISIVNSGDPCQDVNIAKSSAKITVTNTTAQEVVTASASKVIYVCGFSATIQGSATTVGTLQFEYGTKTTNGCDTGTATLTDVFQGNITASVPTLITSGGGGFTQFSTAASNELCAVSTGTTISVKGYLTYVQQ